MASGDTLFVLLPQAYTPPAANYATLDTISDGSTPAATIPVLDFDGAADEFADWIVVVPSHYSATTGFTFQYTYAMDGSDTDLVDLEFSVALLGDTEIATADQGLDDHAEATPVSIQDTPVVSVTANKIAVSPTGALAKSDFAGTVAAGHTIIIRCQRDEGAAENTDDLQLISVHVTET